MFRESLKQISRPPQLSPRPIDAHKGTYGTACIIGGSVGMAGAPRLAAHGALLSGAGLVRLLVPEPILSITASGIPDAMVVPLPADRKGRLALDAEETVKSRLQSVTAFGIGPGLGRSLGLDLLIYRLFTTVKKPAVFDADALNALSTWKIFQQQNRQWLPDLPVRILTPHPGEFTRMSGLSLSSDPESRRKAALLFTHNLRRMEIPAILVLKGPGTIVTDGFRIYVNSTGNPGMATGGSGDILTGMITAFLARGMDPFDAAVLGVFLHGKGGDIAAKTVGEESLTASLLLEALPRAFGEQIVKGEQ